MIEYRFATLKSTNPGTDATEIHSMLADLGLDDKIPKLGEHLERAAAQRARARTNTDGHLNAAKSRLAAEVVAGTKSPEQAAAEYASVESEAHQTRTAAAFYQHSANASATAAFKVLTDMGDALITDILAVEAEKLIETVTTAGELLGEVTTADEAVRAGGAVLKAWGALDAAVGRYWKLQDLAEQLRGVGVLPLTRTVKAQGSGADMCYAEPSVVTPRLLAAEREPLGLLALIQAGARPAVLTAAQVEGIWDQADRSQAQMQDKPKVPTSTFSPTLEQDRAFIDDVFERVGIADDDRLEPAHDVA